MLIVIGLTITISLIAAIQQLVDKDGDVLDGDRFVIVDVGKWGYLIIAQQDIDKSCGIDDGKDAVTIDVAGLGQLDCRAIHIDGNRATAPAAREGNGRMMCANGQRTIDDFDITGLGDKTTLGNQHAETGITMNLVTIVSYSD